MHFLYDYGTAAEFPAAQIDCSCSCTRNLPPSATHPLCSPPPPAVSCSWMCFMMPGRAPDACEKLLQLQSAWFTLLTKLLSDFSFTILKTRLINSILKRKHYHCQRIIFWSYFWPSRALGKSLDHHILALPLEVKANWHPLSSQVFLCLGLNTGEHVLSFHTKLCCNSPGFWVFSALNTLFYKLALLWFSP